MLASSQSKGLAVKLNILSGLFLDKFNAYNPSSKLKADGVLM